MYYEKYFSFSFSNKTCLFSTPGQYLKGNNKKSYSITISFIPFPEYNISIRKNSPLNSIDLLNLENFESTTAVWINDIPSKPLKSVSKKSHDSNQPFTKDPFSTFSKQHLSKVVSVKSTLVKLEFFIWQFLRLQFSNWASWNDIFSKVQSLNEHSRK